MVECHSPEGAEFSRGRPDSHKRLTVVCTGVYFRVNHRLVIDERLHLAACGPDVNAVPAIVFKREIRARQGRFVAAAHLADQLHLLTFEAEQEGAGTRSTNAD